MLFFFFSDEYKRVTHQALCLNNLKINTSGRYSSPPNTSVWMQRNRTTPNSCKATLPCAVQECLRHTAGPHVTSSTSPSQVNCDRPTRPEASWGAAQTRHPPGPRSPRRGRGAFRLGRRAAAPRRRSRTGRGREETPGVGQTRCGSCWSGAPGWGSEAPGRWSASAPAAAWKVFF